MNTAQNILIDSSVYISYFLSEENTHTDSVSLWDRVFRTDDEFRVIVPRLVWSETTSRILRKEGDPELVIVFDTMVKDSSNTEIFEFDETVQVITEMLAYTVNLKTSDLSIAACAKYANATLITWDKQLIKECSKFIDAVTPRGFLRRGKKMKKKH
jgi:predicted nucleic acid-binding protein